MYTKQIYSILCFDASKMLNLLYGKKATNQSADRQSNQQTGLIGKLRFK